MTEPTPNPEETSSLDEAIENLSHEDLLEITQSSIKRLIASDLILSDLPVDVTPEEVLAQIAVIQGQSITVTILRYSENPLNVVIPQQNTTVLDLKKTIRRSFSLKQQRQKSKTKVSWRYVWKTFWLQNIANGKVLKNDKELVSKYGVINRSGIAEHVWTNQHHIQWSEAKVLDTEQHWRKRKFKEAAFMSQNTVLTTEKYPWFEQISRQEQLTLGCDNLGPTRRWRFNVKQLNHILVDHNHKLLYCYVPKVACTNWKRVMMVLTGQSNATNLVSIPADVAHANSSVIRLSNLPNVEIEQILRDYTLFLIARHPFERILSAYRNKFTDRHPSSKYFQARYGRQIIKKYRPTATATELDSGSNVSFPEFVSFLLNEGVDTNEHWTPIYDLCHPCTLNYTFIGHYETLSQDAKTILEMVSAPPVVFPVTRAGHTKDKLREHFQQLSIFNIKHLYKMYLADFKLFGYGLEDLLGYDLA